MRKNTDTKIISSAEAKQLDKIATDIFLIPSIILMENAGKNAADIVLNKFNPKNVLMFCGGGNNGGDGFVIARHLYNNAVKVKVFLAQNPIKYAGDALINLNILKKLKIPIVLLSKNNFTIPKTDLIIDALLGTGTKGEIREPYRRIICKINESRTPVVSVDIPSGIDADTGEILGEAINADLTVTMIAKKTGLIRNDGKKCAGKIIVTDIGIKF